MRARADAPVVVLGERPVPRACGNRSVLVGGWTDWLVPMDPGVQMHVNCREPLGLGSFEHVMELTRRELEERCGFPVVGFGVTQPNSDRCRYHLHSLWAAGVWPTTEQRVPDGRVRLLAVRRWSGEGAVGPVLTELVSSLQPVWRPYSQPSNVGNVQLHAVNPRGPEDDARSLVRYIVRYLLRVGDAGDWIFSGKWEKVLGG